MRLTSGLIKYYRGTGPYYNFKSTDGTTGGQYLYKAGLWGHVTPEVEAGIDLSKIVTYLTAGGDVGQYDGGITPDSLTTEGDGMSTGEECQSVGQLEDRLVTVDQATSEDEYIDDNYTDQESVFGESETEYSCGGVQQVYEGASESPKSHWAR